jgi:hypothetical protein
MQYLTEERETHLHYDLIEKRWTAYTNIPEHMRKLQAKGWELRRIGTDETGKPIEAFLSAPKNAITFRDITKPKRIPKHAFSRAKSDESIADE